MNLADWFEDVAGDEEKCVKYLRHFGIIPENALCPSIKDGFICKSKMKTVVNDCRRNGKKVILRCTRNHCQAKHTIRIYSDFFDNSRLSLSKILTLIYLFCYTRGTQQEKMEAVGTTSYSVCLWMTKCRQVCSRYVNDMPKLIGTAEEPIQIDEAYFRGKRKYNRGRLLNGNRSERGRTGGWVLGFYKSSSEARFVVVPNRSAATLIPIIQRIVAEGSVIITDEWKSYNRLSSLGYIHHTVNHSQNYVDPNTGYHTQGIERMWVEAKLWLKKARRPNHLMQGHLDELTWKLHNDRSEYMPVFMFSIKEYYQNNI